MIDGNTGDNINIRCPKCGSENVRLYEENSITHYLPDNGSYEYTHIFAAFVCDDCQHDFRHDWRIVEPDDDDTL